MSKQEKNILDGLTALLQERFETALEQFQYTDDDYMERYYKGQMDVLYLAQHDIEVLKFDAGMELDLEMLVPPRKEAPSTPADKERETTSKRGKRASKNKPRKKSTQNFTHQKLAQRALEKGVVTQKVSHFYHELLPNGRVKGYNKLYQAFDENEALRRSVEEALQALENQAAEETPQPEQAPETLPETPQETPVTNGEFQAV